MQTFVRGLLPAYSARDQLHFRRPSLSPDYSRMQRLSHQTTLKLDGTHLVFKELMDKIEGLATSYPCHIQKNKNRSANSVQSSGPSWVSHQQQTITCNYCHKTGHVIKNCHVRLSQSRNSHQATSCCPSFVDVKQIQCYRCGRHGHYSSTCRANVSSNQQHHPPLFPSNNYRSTQFRPQNSNSRLRQFGQIFKLLDSVP